MGKKIDLHGSHLLNYSEKVISICKPLLENLGIPFFRYGKVFQDGTRIILSNQPDLFKFYYEEGYYPLTWHDNDLPIGRIQQKNTIWAIQRLSNTPEQNDFENELIKQFNLSQSKDLILKSNKFVEVFSFVSNDFNIYDVKEKLLHRFIYYFKEQAKELIKKSENEKIIVPLREEIKFKDESKTNHKDFLEATPVKCYYLMAPYEGIYLTYREVECLDWCVKGKTSDETARILSISKKTVERHIDNIKQKLQIAKQSQIIAVAIEQNLVDIL